MGGDGVLKIPMETGKLLIPRKIRAALGASNVQVSVITEAWDV